MGMRRLLPLALCIGLVATGAASQTATGTAQTPAAAFRLSPTACEDGGISPVQFGQAAPGPAPGAGTSPALTWANAPAGTRSFFLHMHDLDFVRNRTTDDQVHWLVWNIPATSAGLPEGLPRGSQLPDGSYQISVTGPVYRGPGAGATGPLHHYVFELFALDIVLDVKPGEDAFATRKAIMSAIDGHVLARAAYTGRFRRPQ